MSKFLGVIIGGAEIIAGAALFVFSTGTLAAFGVALIKLGASTLIVGVGTILTSASKTLGGLATSSRNPIAPWNVIIGRDRIGGTVVYLNTFGESDKYMDLVIVLAAHSCKSVDGLYFDNNRVQLGSPGVSEGPLGSNAFSGTSFTPVQVDPSIISIVRVQNVVTVVAGQDIPLLQDGDYMIVQNVHPVSANLNGKFQVSVLAHGPGNRVTFQYLSGGFDISIPSYPGSESGDARTAWVDYGRKVFMEVMLGRQTLGETFQGMLFGTPDDGDTGTLIRPSGSNPWSSSCSLVGKTAVFLRLHYNDAIFANGLPQISFHVSGKDDIFDPRTNSRGYTENAALCIADYLSNTTWGFKAAYGTDIPTGPLVAAANICDERVPLALGGTEPRYTCNGGFLLSMHRGEVLQNLLTSCAGRVTYVGGAYTIWPAAWFGTSASNLIPNYGNPLDGLSGTSVYSEATAPFRWHSAQSTTNLYNGVKGVYVSPVNNWQSADFPRYAQDVAHGYTADANLAQDRGERRWFDIQLPFTISCPMAQRIAKIELLRRRQQGTGTFVFNMMAYKFTPLDVITMDLPYFGWTGKYLEVLSSRLRVDHESTQGGAELIRLSAELEFQETDPSVYEWDIGEELSPAGYQQIIVPDNRTPSGPTNVLLDHELDGIKVTWDQPTDAFVLNGGHIEIEYQLVESPEGLWISLAKMDPTITVAHITGLAIGTSWNVQIRSVNVAGVPSPWLVGTPADSSPLTPGPITIIPELPPTPIFAVEQDNVDLTAVEIAGVSFAPLAPNVDTVSSATFTYYFQSPGDRDYVLSSGISSGALGMILTSTPSTISAGTYVQLDGEIMLCGTPGGTTVPIVRGQLGTSAASHAANTDVFVLEVRSQTVTFPLDFFNGPNAPSWTYSVSLPGAKISCVVGKVSNADGDSPTLTLPQTGLPGFGLQLDTTAGGSASGATTLNITNQDKVLSVTPGNLTVNVVATVFSSIWVNPLGPTITLPQESLEAANSVDVTVKAAVGNTFPVFVLPETSPVADTIENSNAARVLNSGQAETYAAT